jgi:hypothetical protein
MPTFCRHGRFLERCPICSKTLPANEPSGSRAPRAKSRGAASTKTAKAASRTRSGGSLRVRREGRAEDDGYSSQLLQGVHASADAARLAEEIAFANARLAALESEPTDLYAQARALAASDIEQASWICFLAAYLSPLEGEDPFAGIRRALEHSHALSGELPDLSDIPLGPRSSHDPARGSATLLAYRQWVERSSRPAAGAPHDGDTPAGGTQALAFTGDPAWSPQRRFERLHERLALPGLGRMGRYELLVTLGALGLYELQAGSLLLSGAPADDLTTVAAKRVFGIGDPLLLERRARTLAEAVSVPLEALDLALANWGAPQRATLGFPSLSGDVDAYERASDALGL